MYAVTLGQTAYYTCDESKVSGHWRAHEDQHKVQWAKEGKIKFLSRYIWQLITKGYSNIDYEIEARAVAQQWIYDNGPAGKTTLANAAKMKTI